MGTEILMRTEILFGTIAAAGIQIHPALGTQTFAVYRAQRLHRKGQQDLLAQNIADRQLRSCEESSPRVAFGQFDLFILIEHFFVALTEEKIERLVDRHSRRLEASRTPKLETCVQRPGNPDFVSNALGRRRPVQRSDLLETFTSEIDNPGFEGGLKRYFFVGQVLEVDEEFAHITTASAQAPARLPTASAHHLHSAGTESREIRKPVSGRSPSPDRVACWLRIRMPIHRQRQPSSNHRCRKAACMFRSLSDFHRASCRWRPMQIAPPT